MAVIEWPTALPQKPLADGYRRSLPNNLIRSSMGMGSDKVRKRGRFSPENVTATYLLKPNHRVGGTTYNQKTVLENWIHDVIAEGAVCFNWPHPELGRKVRARIKAGNEGLFDLQPYKDTLCWQVTLNLEIWPTVKA